MAEPVPAVDESILKSPNDRKLYRYVVLPSGLSVLLIQDPEIVTSSPADTSAAAGQGDPRSRNKVGAHEDEGSGDEMMDGASSGSDSQGEDESGSDADMDGSDEGEDEDEGEEGEDSDEGKSEDDEDGGRRRGKMGGAPAAAVKKAAAAMAVGIGSLSDPPHLQGLSHYLEHMLFMGSAKYPSENEYDEYISKHGGTSNAFTELEYTNFHFEVSPESLHGALDRFAQFFVAPLCLASSLEREVQAVDSEFSGVLQSDGCRASQLMCHTARPGHPYRQFSWGNKKSLWDLPLAAGLDVRQNILDYYHKHYSAERMSLVVLGGEPLDTLQGWVEELFRGLPTGKGPRPTFAGMQQPFEGRTLYAMPAVRDHHEVTLTFQLPCMWGQYTRKAETYVSHLVGHEGPGSLLSYLKAKRWATEVCAGIDEDGYSANSGVFLFSVTLTLTDAGLAAGPGCGLAAVAATFQYLSMLRATGPQEWVWREMADIADMKFRFQEEEEAMDLCTRLASTLHLYPPKDVLVAEYVHTEYDPQLITAVLDAMQPASSAYRIDLVTQAYPGLKETGLPGLGWGAPTSDTEPWFNLDASWIAVPDSVCQAWSTAAPSPDMHLPPRNPYIATNFTVKSDAHVPGSSHEEQHSTANGSRAAHHTAQDSAGREVAAGAGKGADPAAVSPTALPGGGPGDAAKAADERDKAALATERGLSVVLATPPALVHDQPGLRVWHKLDRCFHTPRANVFFRLASPAWCDSPRSAALTHLALKLLEDCLTEDAYLADVAGLHYSTAPEGIAGLEFKVDGFSHKLPVLAARLFALLSGQDAVAPGKAPGLAGASFDTVKEALLRKYRNMNMQVSKHANYERLFALCARAWHYTTLMPHLEAAQSEEVLAHVRTALTTCHLEVFAHGNLTRGESVTLAQSVAATLGPGCALAASQRTRDNCVALPDGTWVTHTACARNADEENCAVEAYYQVGPAFTARDRALCDLVDQLIYEPAYNTLRTQQQLGYTVHTGTRLTHGVLGLCFVVVSASHGAADVDSRIEAFIASYTNTLAAMTDAEFEQQKAALCANKLSRDRALGDESVRHWDHIWNQRYDFLAREEEVSALQTLTLKDVRAWWSAHMVSIGRTRRKLSVHVLPTKACPAASTTTTVIPTAGVKSPAEAPRKRAKRGQGKTPANSVPEVVVAEDLSVFKQGCAVIPQPVGVEPPVAA